MNCDHTQNHSTPWCGYNIESSWVNYSISVLEPWLLVKGKVVPAKKPLLHKGQTPCPVVSLLNQGKAAVSYQKLNFKATFYQVIKANPNQMFWLTPLPL